MPVVAQDLGTEARRGGGISSPEPMNEDYASSLEHTVSVGDILLSIHCSTRMAARISSDAQQICLPRIWLKPQT